MELEKARAIAESIVDLLRPACDRIEIAGSIRRRKPWVNDIDMVCIPNNQGQLAYALQTLGKVKMSGAKIIRVAMGFTKHIDLDVYIATPETWATLLLIRTGSAVHNIRLCMRARNMGMKLHADGSGLFRIGAIKSDNVDHEVRIAGDTEESIFTALGLPYEIPEQRD